MQYVNGCGGKMDIVDKLKDSYAFLGDPLHREAWEEIERLRDELYLRMCDTELLETIKGVEHGKEETENN